MGIIRFITVLLIGICLNNIAGAQEVIYSPYEKFDVRTGDFSVVGKVGGRSYVYRSSNDGFFLDAYNDSMDRQAVILLDFFPKKIYETRFITYLNKIIVLYQSVDGNKVVQHAALLDEKARLVRGPIALDTAKFGLFGPNKDYFSSAVSEDKKSIFIYGVTERSAELKLKGTWIDDELKIQQEAEVFHNATSALTHGEGILANDGTFYLPAYTLVGAKNFADQLFLLALQKGAGAFTANEVPLNGKYAAGTYMKVDNPKNRIYIGGFYSEKKNGNYEGVLYTYFDINTNSFQVRKNIAFDEQLRLATGDRNTRRAFNDYQVRQLIVRNDGGFVLISEDYYITSRNGYSPGFGYYSFYYPTMASSVREYHYEDILAMSYNGEGVREWHTFIRKDQYSQEDGGVFSSYALVNTGGTLGFMFNDFNSARSRIQLASVDGDGKLSMRSLGTDRKDEPDWLARSGKQVAAREIIVPCLRKRQICFAKVVF